MHKILVGLLSLFAINLASAQNGMIKGLVKSGEGGLPSATVSIGSQTMLTDNDGFFSASLAPGRYTLSITYVGFKNLEQGITIMQGVTQVLELNMTRDEQMGRIVVLGSRSAYYRSNLKTALPVDVINAGELSKSNFNDPKQLLVSNVPSFNSPPQNIGPAAYLEPATLRGLAPDQLLVLVNGRRRHTMAMIYQQLTIGRGTAGTDLNSIPRSAIDKIEVLRDGAAAQYGSDAIAGVINLVLKKTTGKTSINLQTGQRYEGDGEQANFGLNKGFTILKKGFLNCSFDVRYRKPTDRTGLYTGTVYNNFPKNASHDDSIRTIAKDEAMILERGFDRKNVAKVGTPDLLNSGVVLNGGYPFKKQMNLFWTGSYNYRHVDRQFGGGAIYRFPKDPSLVNLVLFPDGFLSYGSPTLRDISGILGLEKTMNNGWFWDISSAYGGNAQQFEAHHTNNASQQSILGKNAPTDFHIGTVRFGQFTNNVNFTRDFADKIPSVKLFNTAMGAEFRIDQFRINQGEEASWYNYDPASGKAGGSQVNFGFNPNNAVSAARRIAAIYADVEVEKNEHFLFDLAGRYEYYSDFGGNLAGKLAVRYRFSDKFTLRSAINNGFRAPSMQQEYFSRTNQVNAKDFTQKLTGTFRNNSDIVRSFGTPPLGPEKSINLSAGFTSQLSARMSVTVDAYWIQIRDRIVLTGGFVDSIPAVKSILASYPDIQSVVFFTNAINTRTRGIEIVWKGFWWVGRGKLELALSANINRTLLFGKIQTSSKLSDDQATKNIVINPEVRGIIEWGQPHQKIISRIEYTMGKLGFRCTNIFAGETRHLNAGTDSVARSRDESFSPKINTSCNINYTPRPWITLALGARNLFNVYPDQVKNIFNTLSGTWKYDSLAPQFGFDGGYYYINLSLNF